MNILAVIFIAVWIVGAILMIDGLVSEWRQRDMPFPQRPSPSLIFRIVKRDERATYVRIMRRTYAIAMRDANRQMARAMRDLGKALRPAINTLAAALSKVLR